MELLTDEEVSKMMKVKLETVRTWVHRNVIPSQIIFKVPGSKGTRRFIKSRLEDWINGSLQA